MKAIESYTGLILAYEKLSINEENVKANRESIVNNIFFIYYILLI